ncbi:MAG: PKD domain-containing protein [Saprospiraceae bacterium]|nr:PKD domain-containing protein [Saprospiraceae bacterium]
MKAILTFFVLFFSVNLFSQNSYLAYESFDGSAGSALNSGSNGQGWGSTWEVQNGVIAGYLFDNNSLTYNNLKTNGNKLSGGYQYVTSGRNLDYQDGGDFDDYVTGGDAIGSTAGTTLWVSVLLNKLSNNNEPIFLDLHNGNLSWCNNCTTNKIGFGYFGTASNVNSDKRWSIRIGNTVYNSSVSCAVNSATLLVLKITFGANKTDFDLYVNPTTIGNSGTPATTSLSQSTSELIRIKSLALYLGDNANNGYADEIRFAKTYAIATADQNVAINLPPIARFSYSPISGQAPVTVSVDASSSTDPEGNPLTYSWNWGDGTPNSTNPVTTHTYAPNITGLITIELTVKDNFNLKNFTNKTIPIYLPGTNYFPCQSSATSLSEATCSQNNGKVRINAGIALNPTYSFKNGSGIDMPLINGNEFQNLAAGKYNVTVTGSNSCKDIFTLTMTTDSSTCPGWSPNMCKMAIGVNVNGLSDWNWEHAFVNRYKHVREDLTTFHDGCNCWDSNVSSQIKVDENGYPIGLPQITTASNATKVRFIISADAGNLKPNEQYVFLYDGIGTFTLNGADIVSNTKGRMLFNVPATSGNIWLDVSYSQPDDYIKKFSIVESI